MSKSELTNKCWEGKQFSMMLKNVHEGICPFCGKNKLVEIEKELYKVYTSCSNRKLNATEIINRCINMTLRLQKNVRYYCKERTYSAYIKRLEELKRGFVLLDLFNNPAKSKLKKLKESAVLKIANDFPTEEMIRKAYDDYISWKIAEKI